jgi:glycosyltransferase involved in cell wall biosynthesis
LDEVRHEFALCYEGQLSDELLATGVPVHLLYPARVRYPWTVWKARRRLARVLAERAFDAVVCHSCWPHVLFSPVVKRARLPCLFWAHEALSGRHWLEWWARWTRPDRIIANSRFTAASLPRLFPGVPVEVQYCPVLPPTEFDRAAVRAECGVAPGEVVLVQVSRLERLKGQAVLIEALARLRDVPGWVCWFVGGPQRPHELAYQAELEAAVRYHGLESRVHVLGQSDQVDRLLAAADIYCQPNVGPDSFGITFVQAMYAGLPVVTSALGGALEIVDGECGYLLPPGDVGQLADTLRELIREPALRGRLGNAGPERARLLCSPESTCRSLRDFLGRAVRS